jgi:hypothetical protein
MNNGWIKIHRKMMEHWVYQNSQYFHWWTDLLMNANFEDKKILIKGNLYDCKRGQSLYSLDTWAKRWKVDKSKVRRFLQLLQNDGMIVIENVSVSTRITICKYECYQDERNADETEVKRKRNADETQMTPTKELKKDKKEKKEEEDISFLRFWDLYGKKVDRQASERKWNKIDSELHELIFAHVADYVASTPQIQYRKNPETYLNNRSWENEIVMEAKPTDKKFKVETMWAFGVIKDEFETLAEAEEKIEWYKNRKDAVFNPKLL